jgi:hypothetical protein
MKFVVVDGRTLRARSFCALCFGESYLRDRNCFQLIKGGFPPRSSWRARPNAICNLPSETEIQFDRLGRSNRSDDLVGMRLRQTLARTRKASQLVGVRSVARRSPHAWRIEMTVRSALIAATLFAVATATPAFAQAVIDDPGRCAQDYPNANCQNYGPGNPYTDGGYYRNDLQRMSASLNHLSLSHRRRQHR